MAPSASIPGPVIVVGIDFSEYSKRALALAAKMALELGARLHAVHVRDPAKSVRLGEFVTPLSLMAALDRFDAESRRMHDDCAALCRRIAGDRVGAVVHVLTGRVSETLLQLIHAFRPELVVVGSHGRGAPGGMLSGSTSMELCRTSPVPVLVVPGPAPARAGIHAPGPLAKAGGMSAKSTRPPETASAAEG